MGGFGSAIKPGKGIAGGLISATLRPILPQVGAVGQGAMNQTGATPGLASGSGQMAVPGAAPASPGMTAGATVCPSCGQAMQNTQVMQPAVMPATANYALPSGTLQQQSGMEDPSLMRSSYGA